MVTADTREPKILVGRKPTGQGGLLYQALPPGQLLVQKLDSADFRLFDVDGHSLGLERKHGTDLTASLGGKSQANGAKRFYNQVDRMALEYTHSGLILEGSVEYNDADATVILDGQFTGWNWLSLEMLLWRFNQRGLILFRTPSMTATVQLLRRLNERATKGCVLGSIK